MADVLDVDVEDKGGFSEDEGEGKNKVIVKKWEQLQNSGPLLTMDQTSRLVWLGSGKN